MLTGAIIGAIIGLLVVVFNFFAKEQRFNKVLKSIKEPMEYAALYHYASFKRYKSSFKFFDSYGVLYVVGKTAYYKTTETATPMIFNLAECTVQKEEDWRLLKWFSITTPAGEKFYFDSHKMGVLKNNSDETLKGLEVLRSKTV
ncbi:MAG TPA: hypothetical protein VMZ03_08460 [Chitinophagaceae bacterium]|nr:hypothetical protein [Chitinophagaceae bacterium]